MKKAQSNIQPKNAISDGIIISTTNFPKNSNPREFTMEWNKGSEKIVGMMEKVLDKTPTQKTVFQQTPFKPQYIFTFSDEQSMLDPNRPPQKLWWEASNYQDWIFNNCKGNAPEFKAVVENLCQGRLVLFIGLGGCIFCELNNDATALMQYYHD